MAANAVDARWRDHFDGGGRVVEPPQFGKPPSTIRKLKIVVHAARNITASQPTLVEATLGHQNATSSLCSTKEQHHTQSGVTSSFFSAAMGSMAKSYSRMLQNPRYDDATFTFDAFQPWAGAHLMVELRGKSKISEATTPTPFAGRLRIPVDRIVSSSVKDATAPKWCRLTDRPPGEEDTGAAFASTIGFSAHDVASSQEIPDAELTFSIYCDDNDRHRVWAKVISSRGVWLSRARVKVSLVYTKPDAAPDRFDEEALAAAQKAKDLYEEGAIDESDTTAPRGPTLGPFVTAPPRADTTKITASQEFAWDDGKATFSFWPVCLAKEPWLLIELAGIPHNITGKPMASSRRASLLTRARSATASALTGLTRGGVRDVAQVWQPVSVNLKQDPRTVSWQKHRATVRMAAQKDDSVNRGSLNIDAKILGAQGDRLQVVVLRAKNLPPVSDRGTGCDTYVVVEIGKKRFRTTVARATCNPIWNEALHFHFSECFPDRRGYVGGFAKLTTSDQLGFEVYHSNAAATKKASSSSESAGDQGAAAAAAAAAEDLTSGGDDVFLGATSFPMSEFVDDDDAKGEGDDEDDAPRRPGARDAGAALTLLEAGTDFGERYAVEQATTPTRSFWAALRSKAYRGITGEVLVSCYFDDGEPGKPIESDPVLKHLRQDALRQTRRGNDEAGDGDEEWKRERDRMLAMASSKGVKNSFKLGKSSKSPTKKKGEEDGVDAELEAALMEVFQLAAKRERTKASAALAHALERKALREAARGDTGTDFYKAMETQRRLAKGISRRKKKKNKGGIGGGGGGGGDDDDLEEETEAQRRRLHEAIGGARRSSLSMVSAYDGGGEAILLAADWESERPKDRWASEALGSMAPTVAPAF